MKKRRGFTIIELLVVISVIAVLFALTVKGVGAVLENARESATKATLHKIRSSLSTRYEGFSRLSKRKGFLQSQPEYIVAKLVPGSDNNRYPTLTKKLMERSYFPQRRQEVLDADFFCGYQRYPSISAAPSASSAEILYAFLSDNSVVGDIPAESDSYSPQEVQDTDQNGLMEFVDGWGRPLRFYRWPTRFLQSPESKLMIPSLPDGIGYPLKDSDDPLNLMTSIPNFATTGVPPDGRILTTAIAGPLFHDPGAYHIALVCSAGPDGIFGLKDPAETQNTTPASYGYLGEIDNSEALLDDIFSVIRAGGK
jgi:prepilin-type N-terminal cleavage/methylation domain-containing protein